MSESVHPYLASSTISPNEAQLTVQEARLLPSAIFGERKHLGKPHIWNESISVEEGRDLVCRRLRGGEPPWRRTIRGGGGRREKGRDGNNAFQTKAERGYDHRVRETQREKERKKEAPLMANQLLHHLPIPFPLHRHFYLQNAAVL
ncbi:hypothetical protein AXX17_AT5G28590 [Arabidopsis thaliana]|uniref:Uncharacterized protein n=1 Tax=Arabidopsis thaliana TaxID=3702 RepID=A0A178U6Y6_ARATH|nr:hypothetical protein AXX17_AT5G28590 [Arabidopsis thaliana]